MTPDMTPDMTDPIAAMREALGVLCDEIEATEEHGAAAFEDFCPVCKAIDGARAALAAYDAAGRTVKFGDDEMDEDGIRSMAEYRAAVGEPLLRRHATWQPEDDCRDKTVPEMVAHIYKNRKGLAVAPNGHTTPFLTVEEWSRIADFLKDYDFQPRQTSPGQSADVEEMARTIADIWGPAGERREYLYSDLLSFAARVADDQREKDAKIAETPDQQRANKTAAQIATAIRAQGERE